MYLEHKYVLTCFYFVSVFILEALCIETVVLTVFFDLCN